MEPETQQPISFDSLKTAAESILAQYHESSVGIENPALLTDPRRRNRIWRCNLRSSAPSVPETAIIKQVNPDGYDPANPESNATWRLFNDWAGAQFLSQVASKDPHAPAFYGGNLEQGFVILEDLGEHSSLVEQLLGTDADSATEALIALASRLGRMHASTMGKKEEFFHIKRRISPAWADQDTKSSDNTDLSIAKQIAQFAEACERLTVKPSDAAIEEFGGALHILAEPGPFEAYVHCDPCPDNTFYHPPNLRLIDFEFSCFGHALTDGLYGRLAFPTCWCANSVPNEIVHQMEDTYRRELSVACPEVMDNARFERGAAAVTANWAFTSTRWGVEDLMERDEEWGIASIRARIIKRVEVFLDTAGRAKHIPALSDTFTRILGELKNRWPESEALPFYPAFRDPTE